MILRQLTDEISLKEINTILTSQALTTPSDVLTGLLTFAASSKTKVYKISCTGQINAKYQLYIDNSLVETRISAPHRTIEFVFDYPLVLSATQVLDIKVIHFVTGEQIDFQSTMYAFV